MILLTGYATNSCNVKKNFEIQKLTFAIYPTPIAQYAL